ncbi:MAG: DNA polymerase IV [Actinomycetota bacterium]
MTGRRILHADLDAFYASVEQRDDPSLRGIPMAVGGGVILAASYEARRFGVRTAMNERQARVRCPALTVVPPRMTAYAEASDAVFTIFRDISPEVEPLSIDEAFIDVTGLRRLAGSDVSIAASLRERVAAEVGLAVSVGGGSTKFLAKVASAVCKPDGLLVVPAGEELAFLHPLPVGRLWGVGPVAQERLASAGLHTVADVAALDVEVLQDRLGVASGAHLHALAHNRDPRPVETGRRRRSIGSQRSFPAGSVDREGAAQIVVEVADRVARRLRAGARVGRTVTLRLRFADFAAATRSRTLREPTASTEAILSTGRALLDDAWPLIERRGLTKVGLAISGLADDRAVQLSLPFGAAAASPSWDAVDGAVDRIRDRFGTGALTRATLVDRQPVEVPLLPD